MTQAIILAGGRGERLRPLTDTLPKPMVPVGGKPFLDWLISQLGAQGVSKILILGGYLGDVILDHYASNQMRRDESVQIDVIISAAHLSTGERLLDARDSLEPEFFLLYGDNYARFYSQEITAVMTRSGASGVLSLVAKSPGNIGASADGLVFEYSVEGRSESLDYVEIGYMLLKREAILAHLGEQRANLPAALSSMASCDELRGLIVEHPYFSVSDIERLEIIRRAVTPQKVLFLDRDGVLNAKPEPGEYVKNSDEFVPIKDSWAAIKYLSDQGFSFVVVTNQAGLEIGSVTKDGLESINHEILDRFSEFGGKLLGIYVCPHHWDTNCTCRKPKPGLLYKAAHEHKLILDQLMMIGDQKSDFDAALAAGVTPVRLGDTRGAVESGSLYFPSLLKAVGTILDHYNLVERKKFFGFETLEQ